MLFFVFLNLICLSIILAKLISYSEYNRYETSMYVDKLFGIPKKELDLIREDQEIADSGVSADTEIDTDSSYTDTEIEVD